MTMVRCLAMLLRPLGWPLLVVARPLNACHYPTHAATVNLASVTSRYHRPPTMSFGSSPRFGTVALSF